MQMLRTPSGPAFHCSQATSPPMTLLLIFLLIFSQTIYLLTQTQSITNEWDILFFITLLLAMTLLIGKPVKTALLHFWGGWGAGGLGMLIGAGIDLAVGTSNPHIHHQHPEYPISNIFNWSTGIMILFCVPTCIYLCQARLKGLTPAISFTAHLLSAASMVIGMYLSMIFLNTYKWALSPFEMHIFMVTLMALCGAVVFMLFFIVMRKIPAYLKTSLHQIP